MVFRSRNRPAEERSKRPADFDLLTTLFGLPNRHTLECDERQRARRVVLSYVTDGHQHVGVQQDGRDSSEGESESESESESLEAGPGRLADSDLATDDDYGHVESRQVTVKIPRRASMKKTPKHHERRQDLDAIPVKSHQTKKLEKKNLKPRKQHRDKSVSEGSKASEVSRASQISPPPSSSATSIPTTRGRKSRRASANGVTSTLGPQLHFVPQPPFELPIQSVVQNPISLQPQQQLPPPQGYYHQPSFAYPGGVDASMMAPTSAPVPFQQWSDAGYLPHPNGVLSGLGHDATPQPEKSGPLNNAEEVKKIQAQIDRVVAQLQQNPRGTKLNTKMKSLQVLLNEALNKATAHQSQGKKPSHSQPPSEEKQIQTSKSKPLGNSQKDCSDESRKSSEASVLGSSRGEASTVVGGEGRTHLHHQRANSLTGDSPRHRCYNCGNSRSMWYHERYPIETSRRARNLCENCRDDLLRGGIVGQRHYCCGCGRARSSNFHRKNPAIPGDALLLSHCRNCEDEMRTADGTTNASVGDSHISASEKTSSRHGQSVSDHHQPRSNRSQKSSSSSQNKPVHQAVSDSSDNLGSQLQYQTRLYYDGNEDGVGKNIDGSYCPVRKLGSSKRRAERTTTTIVEDSSANDSKPNSDEDGNPKYKHPWVEDSSSYVTGIVPNAAASVMSGRSNRRVGLSASTESPQTPPCRAKPSDEASGSTASDHRSSSSSRSSSGKSVAFNPSVSVRQPSRRATSEVSSDSDVEDTPIKPDDNSTPRRAGIFGGSPVRNEYGQPVSTPERLYSQEARRFYSTSPRLWNFGQGSYAHGSDGSENGRYASGSQSPDFDHSKGIFSGMSDFDTNDWKKFAEETSEKESVAAGDEFFNSAYQKARCYDEDGHVSPQNRSSHGFREAFPPTPRPAKGFAPGFMGGSQGRGNNQDDTAGWSRSGGYSRGEERSFKSADNQQRGFGSWQTNSAWSDRLHAGHPETPFRSPPASSFASFVDRSGMYSHEYDDDRGVYEGTHGAFGYVDDCSDGRRSDGDDLRNFWFQNGAEGRWFEDYADEDVDFVAEPIIEEIESDDDDDDDDEEGAAASQRLLLEYHEPTVPTAQGGSSDGKETEIFRILEQSPRTIIEDSTRAS